LCNLSAWGQGDQTTGRDNRGEIITITSIFGHFSCRSRQSFSINQLYKKIRLLNSFLIR